MRVKPLSDLLILVSVFGFVTWAFCQILFVNTSYNSNEHSRLLFPIIVPILSGVFVYIGYVIRIKHFPNKFIISSLTVTNLAYLIFASLGLALAYFLYTLLITMDSKNIAIIPVLNTLFLMLISFFVTYKNDEFIIKLNATWPQVIGAVITLVGVIIMKYGDVIIKTMKLKSN
jgi:drug/metabolite transporter (DMT)-like permease